MSLFNNISNYLLSKKESPKTAQQFVSWNQLSKVLIVVYDNQLSQCLEFMNACKNDKINVQVAIIFEGKPEQAPKPDFDHFILDKKQFSFFGIPSHTCLQKLSVKPIDVVINLGSSKQFKALTLTQLVSAKCKIGNFQNPAFDITINSDKTLNSSEFLKQVIVYLNMIKPTTKL